MAAYCCDCLLFVYLVLLVQVFGSLNNTSGTRQTQKPLSILEHISSKSNSFGFAVYKRLPEQVKKDGNVLLSPLSLFTTFSQICIGARGFTESEMIESLYWANDDYQFLYFMHPWLQSIYFNNDELQLGNKLWVSDRVQLLPNFEQAVRNQFGTEIGQMDVEIGAKAEQKINRWVRENTKGMIKNLIPANTINSMTRLVLTNAVYFKASWAKQFPVSRTRTGVFCLPTSNDRCSYNARNTVTQPENEHQTTVYYMNQRGSFPYAIVRFGGQSCQMLLLPYKESRGQKFSLVLLLPPAVSSMLKLDGMLTFNVVNKLMRKLKERTVDVTIPKLNVTCKLEMDGALLGMKKLFSSGEANLSGINGKRDLFVSKVVHEVSFAVDEQGSEAGAATGAVIQTRMSNPDFVANRPFFFFILHKPSNAIVFSGKINNPNKQ